MFKKKYPSLSFWENFLGGHVNIGPITIYGENAMHWGVNIWTKKFGYICFRLPVRCFGKWWPLYFYTSPNATPWASTFYRGEPPGMAEEAAHRRHLYGFRFDTNVLFNE